VLTVEYKINLVAPGRGEAFRARAEVVAAGRRIKTVVASVHGETDGQPPLLIAQAQATMMTPEGVDA
jgi:acyl-coenzyme A thioesterase PaaI-like protein